MALSTAGSICNLLQLRREGEGVLHQSLVTQTEGAWLTGWHSVICDSYQLPDRLHVKRRSDVTVHLVT